MKHNLSSYSNNKCRCRICTKANLVYRKSYVKKHHQEYKDYAKAYAKDHYLPSLVRGGGSGFVRADGTIRWERWEPVANVVRKGITLEHALNMEENMKLKQSLVDKLVYGWIKRADNKKPPGLTEEELTNLLDLHKAMESILTGKVIL